MSKQKKKPSYKWRIEEKQKWWQIGRLKKGEKLDFWPFGNFVVIPKKGELAQTDIFELKIWRVKRGEESKHSPKVQFEAREYTFILQGETKGKVIKPAKKSNEAALSKEIILKEGDYIIIEPHVINNLVQRVITKEVRGLTIKIPSDPEDNIKKRDFDKID